MAFFPFMIDISNKRILIVGGGRSALHKVKAFDGFDALLTIVAEDFTPEVKAAALAAGAQMTKASYDEAILEWYDIVVAATDDRALNARITARCRELGIAANAVDDRDNSDFIFPAMIKMSNYTVAISTDGRSPLLAREIKKNIAQRLPKEFDEAVGALGEMRKDVLRTETTQEERMEIFAKAAEKYLGKRKIRIGTRGSALAMIQTEMVMALLKEQGIESEAIVIKTQGDRLKDKPLWKFGGKAVFVTEFEDAILRGDIDLAVHSAKDMPATTPEGVEVLACLPREDARDVLITRHDTEVQEIRRVGTGSLRRQVQIQAMNENFECALLRGNVPTRLEKLRQGEYDAIILAAAGIKRLGLDQDPGLNYHYLNTNDYIPAAGQGIIAIEGRADGDIADVVRAIGDPAALQQAMLERGFMHKIHAGCHEAVGAYSEISEDGIVRMHVMKKVGGRVFRYDDQAALPEAESIMSELAARINSATQLYGNSEEDADNAHDAIQVDDSVIRETEALLQQAAEGGESVEMSAEQPVELPAANRPIEEMEEHHG